MTDIHFKLNTGAKIPALGLGMPIKEHYHKKDMRLMVEKEHGKAPRDKSVQLSHMQSKSGMLETSKVRLSYDS